MASKEREREKKKERERKSWSQLFGLKMERYGLLRAGPCPQPASDSEDDADAEWKRVVRENTAALLGLAWPPADAPSKHQRGPKPCHEHYERALYHWLGGDAVLQEDAVLPSPTVPKGWRSGMALRVPEDAPAGADSGACTAVPAEKQTWDELFPDTEQPPLKKKKPYFRPGQELRTWTAHHCHMRKKQGWNPSDTCQRLRDIFPAVFVPWFTDKVVRRDLLRSEAAPPRD